MSSEIEEWLDQAKKLPEADRRRLVDELAATLSEEDDEVFLAELDRRVAEGVTGGMNWETLKKTI